MTPNPKDLPMTESGVACIACAGEEYNPGFDYCRACGRVAPSVAYGAAAQAAKPESRLSRAVRLARGCIEPEDVPDLIGRWTAALKRAERLSEPPHD